MIWYLQVYLDRTLNCLSFILSFNRSILNPKNLVLAFTYSYFNQSGAYLAPVIGSISVVSDASLATEFDIKSRARAIVLPGNKLFHGFSKKSTIICEPSAEAELDALNTGEKIALLLKLKLDKIVGPNKVKMDIITDTKSALHRLKQEYVKARIKLLELRIKTSKKKNKR